MIDPALVRTKLTNAFYRKAFVQKISAFFPIFTGTAEPTRHAYKFALNLIANFNAVYNAFINAFNAVALGLDYPSLRMSPWNYCRDQHQDTVDEDWLSLAPITVETLDDFFALFCIGTGGQFCDPFPPTVERDFTMCLSRDLVEINDNNKFYRYASIYSGITLSDVIAQLIRNGKLSSILAAIEWNDDRIPRRIVFGIAHVVPKTSGKYKGAWWFTRYLVGTNGHAAAIAYARHDMENTFRTTFRPDAVDVVIEVH